VKAQRAQKILAIIGEETIEIESMADVVAHKAWL
jgi:hypothetical protein